MASALAPKESFATAYRAQRATAYRCVYENHQGNEAATQRCHSCKKVFYCGKKHQIADWATHKTECKKLQQVNRVNAGATSADHGPAAAAAVKTAVKRSPKSFTFSSSDIARSKGCWYWRWR